MENNKELYTRFLNRQCSREEAEQLLAYFRTQEGDEEMVKWIEDRLAEDPDLTRLTPTDFEVISTVGQRIERITRKKTYQLRRWLPYAAAALLIAGTLSWLLLDQTLPLHFGGEQQVDLATEDILPGGNQATLQLSDGRVITLDEAQNTIVFGESDVKYSNGTAIAEVSRDRQRYSTTDTLTLTTPRGGTYQVTLSDGTKIWLNAGTTLKYPARFATNERVVFLEGEAFFDVAHKLTKNTKSSTSGKTPVPFKVISKGQEVEVLGTKFNISAYKENTQIYTTLTEGKVRVNISNSLQATDPRSESMTLTPGQQAIASNQAVHVRNVDTSPYTAWKDGLFHFDNTLPQIAVAELARWYDLDVAYEGRVPETRLFGIIDRNKPLSAVLKSLEKSGLMFKVVRTAERHRLIILGEK